jgi:hypothetical protein
MFGMTCKDKSKSIDYTCPVSQINWREKNFFILCSWIIFLAKLLFFVILNWKILSIIVVFFSAIGSISGSFHKSFQISNRLFEARQCMTRLKSLELSISTSGMNNADALKDYQNIWKIPLKHRPQFYSQLKIIEISGSG